MLVALAVVEAAVLAVAVWAMRVMNAPAAVEPHSAGALATAATLSLCCIAAFYYTDLYDRHAATDLRAFPWRLTRATGVAFMLLSVLFTFVPQMRLPAGVMVPSLTIAALLLLTRLIGCGVIRSPWLRHRVMIVGSGPLATTLFEEIEAQPHLRYDVFLVTHAVVAGGEHRLAGPPERLAELIEEIRPSRIIVTPEERRGRLAVRQLLESRARGILVEDGLDAYERLTGKLAIESLQPSALLFSPGFRRARGHRALARLMSLSVAAVGLVLLGPLMAVIAVAIALDSRGGIFFVQERVGRHNRAFRLIKFRTMRPVPRDATLWVRDNTHRITRVGKWLRKFRLDELPQFINILRGDMNLVGPRPHPLSNYALFTDRIPYYSLRSVVRPGVTGWAQVRYGYANDLYEETEKMRYDLYYVKHMSIWFDLRVLFDTVKVVCVGLGASAVAHERTGDAALDDLPAPAATRARDAA
jgi:exopolysaccharide biosynthesis polyprenyl glycosylphosphotransferase